MKLYHPDRFRHEPDKLATYERLTAAINHAKDSGDIGTLRQIAGDPQGFILRQGWAGLDFREEEQAARLRKLWESLELEILAVLEATNRLRESPEFELLGLTAKEPALFDRVVAGAVHQKAWPIFKEPGRPLNKLTLVAGAPRLLVPRPRHFSNRSQHTAALKKEIAGLTSAAEMLAAEIAELTSQAAPG